MSRFFAGTSNLLFPGVFRGLLSSVIAYASSEDRCSSPTVFQNRLRVCSAPTSLAYEHVGGDEVSGRDGRLVAVTAGPSVACVTCHRRAEHTILGGRVTERRADKPRRGARTDIVGVGASVAGGRGSVTRWARVVLSVSALDRGRV
jgi:hypothetical protein